MYNMGFKAVPTKFADVNKDFLNKFYKFYSAGTFYRMRQTRLVTFIPPL